MAAQALTNPSLTAAICTLEHKAWAALCTSGNDLLPLLDESPVMIFPGNLLLTSTSSPSVREILQSVDYKPWVSYSLSHDEVVPLGSDSAIIYYRVEAKRADETFQAICSSVWTLNREDVQAATGGWKMKSHQQTLM